MAPPLRCDPKVDVWRSETRTLAADRDNFEPRVDASLASTHRRPTDVATRGLAAGNREPSDPQCVEPPDPMF